MQIRHHNHPPPHSALAIMHISHQPCISVLFAPFKLFGLFHKLPNEVKFITHWDTDRNKNIFSSIINISGNGKTFTVFPTSNFVTNHYMISNIQVLNLGWVNKFRNKIWWMAMGRRIKSFHFRRSGIRYSYKYKKKYKSYPVWFSFQLLLSILLVLE